MLSPKLPARQFATSEISASVRAATERLPGRFERGKETVSVLDETVSVSVLDDDSGMCQPLSYHCYHVRPANMISQSQGL